MAERVFRLLVEYDGSGYSGFQRQPEDGPPSVQGELERALSRLMDHPVHVLGAGRTDAGVHATGQVVAFRTERPRPVDVLVRGGNALLPVDIRILEAAEAPPDFHPRFSAVSRTYDYLLLRDPHPDALFLKRAWHVPGPLDLEAMSRSARPLLGEHDFSAWCARVPAGESRVRTLLDLDVLSGPADTPPGPFGRLAGMVALRVRADGFLRRMVRMLVAALVAVGRGEWEEDRPRRVLESRDPGEAPPPAPASGLYLVAVEYPAVFESGFRPPAN